MGFKPIQIGKQYTMPYSQLQNQLESLLSAQPLEIVNKKGGGNSVVYCVVSKDQKWAVKSYPPHVSGQRDRLAAERAVYQFLNQHQIAAVPHLKTVSESDRLLVMDWIEGDIPADYQVEDVEQCIQFIRSIHQLNSLPKALALPLAAEACLSLNILVAQVQQRLKRLQDLPEKDADLTRFLETEFIPTFDQYTQQARNGFLANKLDPEAALPQSKRSLIPADFGFHNSIRDVNGKLYFFDFDYFGWDDPVKLLADILWHPKMHLTASQKQQFIDGLADVYHTDKAFLTRFYYTWPLFGLRWTLILLNEFIPTLWQNRQHADTYKNLAQTQHEVQQMQLKRAQTLLQMVRAVECPYEA